MTQHAYQTSLQLKLKKSIASINFRQRRSKARAFALFPLRCYVTVPTKIFVTSPPSPPPCLSQLKLEKKFAKLLNLAGAESGLAEKWRK